MRAEARLAAGVSRLRLSLETGIRNDLLGAMLERKWLNGLNPGGYHNTEADEAFSALEQWLEDYPAAHESRASRAETPSFKALSTLLTIAHQSRSH